MMSFDLLVYGLLVPDDLIAKWEQAASETGVYINFFPRMPLMNHVGYLPLQVRVAKHASFSQTSEYQGKGAYKGGFEYCVEHFTPVDLQDEGLAEVPEPQATVIRRAVFCAVFTISWLDSPISCIAAFHAALALAKVTAGVVVDTTKDNYWTPEQAMEQVDQYLDKIVQIKQCSTVDKMSGE